MRNRESKAISRLSYNSAVTCVAYLAGSPHNPTMLGFLDESGDTGLKVSSGSSPFFVVALVTFDDDEEALRCDPKN